MSHPISSLLTMKSFFYSRRRKTPSHAQFVSSMLIIVHLQN
ncbi:unnamed protein product [Amoebophrya sp. A120]|nr:unnamed protein product [Amoebophrya sp. A120]|eukprot:GSA120T00017570001.1